MIVVSDTSPIMNLAAIGQLDLLRQLYGSIVVPQAVYNELANRPDLPGGTEVQSSDWIAAKSPANALLVQSLLVELDFRAFVILLSAAGSADGIETR